MEAEFENGFVCGYVLLDQHGPSPSEGDTALSPAGALLLCGTRDKWFSTRVTFSFSKPKGWWHSEPEPHLVQQLLR